LGYSTVDGKNCSVWTWEPYESYIIQMWVDPKTTAYGSGIVQILIKNSPYVGDILWDFTNVKPGPFNPNIYNPPNLKCIPPPFGGGTGLSSFKNIINPVDAMVAMKKLLLN